MSFQPSLASWVRVSHSVGDLFGSGGVELSFPPLPSHQIETRSLPWPCPWGLWDGRSVSRDWFGDLDSWGDDRGQIYLVPERLEDCCLWEKSESGFLGPFLFNLLEQRCAGEQKQCLLLALLGKWPYKAYPVYLMVPVNPSGPGRSPVTSTKPLACPPVSAAPQCPGAETQHVDHSRKSLMEGSKYYKINQTVTLNSKHVPIAF